MEPGCPCEHPVWFERRRALACVRIPSSATSRCQKQACEQAQGGWAYVLAGGRLARRTRKGDQREAGLRAVHNAAELPQARQAQCAAAAAAAAAARRRPLGRRPCLHPPPLQTATLVVLNACLVGCILVCASLLLVPAGLPTELVPHIVGLLLLAAALAFSVNW